MNGLLGNQNERDNLIQQTQQPSTSSTYTKFVFASSALFIAATLGVFAITSKSSVFPVRISTTTDNKLGSMRDQSNNNKNNDDDNFGGLKKIERAIENSFDVFNRADVMHEHENLLHSDLRPHPIATLGATKASSSEKGPHVNFGNYKPLNAAYEPVLDIPVVFIALRNNDEDLWKVRRTIETLAGETRVNYEDLAETVSVSQGIDARKWPKDIANAEYAIKDIRKLFHKKVNDGTVFASDVKDFHQLMGLLKQIDTRKADGSLDQFSIDKGLSHHVGCLYAHLYQWQWVKDQGWPIAWIMESDGNKMTNVPFWAVQTLTENMPKEADVLFLQNFMREPGFEGPHFKSVGVRGPNGANAKIDIYKMNTRASALSGLQSYVITQSFIKKAHNFIATYGADMVDAFTAGNMCAYKDWWNQADISKGEKPILNCFQALSKPIEVEGKAPTMVAGR